MESCAAENGKETIMSELVIRPENDEGMFEEWHIINFEPENCMVCD